MIIVSKSWFLPLFTASNSRGLLPCCYHTLLAPLLEISTHTEHFNQIFSHAIAAGRFKDPLISSKLLYSSLSLLNDLAFSRTLFFQIQNPNIFAWNFMFKAYSQSPFPDQSVRLYNQMRQDGLIAPDNFTFPLILKACARLSLLEKGEEIHSVCFKLSLESNIFVQNSLITMYSMCGVIHVARKVFDMVPPSLRDRVSWHAMFYGYLQSNQCGNALKVFGNSLPYWTSWPDRAAIISAFNLCARAGLIDLGKKLHGLLVLNGCDLDAFVGSSLVDMYAKCGQIEEARKVFDKMPDRNVVCWNCMISGYTRSDLNNEAIELFREMQALGVTAEATAVACVVTACGRLGALDEGRWMQAHCEKNGIELNLAARTAFIDMYSKCGDIRKAMDIFDSLTHKDVFAWTAMIYGLAVNGESSQALSLFSLMEMSADVTPNEVTFLGVLSACSHAGYVDKGLSYFKAMTESYHLVPHIEHYGCVVDLLCRASLLVEAVKFVAALPIQPDVVIWSSLLFACRNHGNIELAEVAAKRIEELDPCRGVAHALLSNAYASAFLWADAKRVRSKMAVHRIRKQPGCSFLEINGLVHEFYAADGC